MKDIVLMVLLAVALAGLFFLYQDKQALIVQTAELTGKLKLSETALATSSEALALEKSKNDQLAAQFGQIQGTVATLDKLSKTDPELLRRYSQVYFLPDSYIPAALVEIDRRFWNDPNRSEKIQTGVKRHLEEMMSAAAGVAAAVTVVSAYRSFGEQGDLKQKYAITYGTGANTFSADQGYSEHQLGTAVDFSTPVLKGLTGFEKSTAYAWLNSNAYRYGFILSYPAKNGYFQFEPWHWRFVGVRLATYLYTNNKQFFSLPQREINTYLVDLFD